MAASSFSPPGYFSNFTMTIKIILDGEELGQELSDEDIEQIQNSQIIKQENDMVIPQEISDNAETLKEMDKDEIDIGQKMSTIDTRSRLHYTEISGLLTIDTWVGFGALPLSCMDFTRRKKRLAISLNGEGRKEKVQLIGGKKELEAAQGGNKFTEGMKKMFGIGANKQ